MRGRRRKRKKKEKKKKKIPFLQKIKLELDELRLMVGRKEASFEWAAKEKKIYIGADGTFSSSSRPDSCHGKFVSILLSYPTSIALSISFRLSSNAEILLLSTD